MSKLFGQCPDCLRPLIQDYAAGGNRYLSCMGGHAWRETAGHLYERTPDNQEEGPVQVVIPAREHEAIIPEQPDAFKWVYGHD